MTTGGFPNPEISLGYLVLLNQTKWQPCIAFSVPTIRHQICFLSFHDSLLHFKPLAFRKCA